MSTLSSITTPPAPHDADWLRNLLAHDYPDDWKLTVNESERLYQLCEAGLATTNGDTAPVEITARQLILLLQSRVRSKSFV